MLCIHSDRAVSRSGGVGFVRRSCVRAAPAFRLWRVRSWPASRQLRFRPSGAALWCTTTAFFAHARTFCRGSRGLRCGMGVFNGVGVGACPSLCPRLLPSGILANVPLRRCSRTSPQRRLWRTWRRCPALAASPVEVRVLLPSWSQCWRTRGPGGPTFAEVCTSGIPFVGTPLLATPACLLAFGVVAALRDRRA
jgi:hypothetical protein